MNSNVICMLFSEQIPKQRKDTFTFANKVRMLKQNILAKPGDKQQKTKHVKF